MNYEQLYIDNVLMDTDEKTDITLELKSNLLADISKLSSNHSYTIRLPKTVHNLTVFGHADRFGNASTCPYAFHSARFFRNGVELIADGRAALLSATDTLEIAIAWGLSSPFDALKGDDLKLNDLDGNESILWNTSNAPTTPASFFTQGYGYVGYSPWINEKTDNGWQNTDVTHNAETVTSYPVISGYSIDTGEAVGDVALLNPEAKANWGYLVLPFHLTSLVTMSHVVGGAGNNRLWAVLDTYDRVIKIAGANANLSGVVVAASTNAAKIVINLDLTLSQQNYVTLHEYVSAGTAINFGGAAGNEGLKYIHPSASVAWILGKIQSKTGVTCSWSGAAKTLIDNLAIPLVSKKATAALQSLNAYARLEPMSALGAMSIKIDGTNDIFTETPNTIISQLTIARDCGVLFDVRSTWSWDASNAVSNSSTDALYNGTSRSMYQYIYFVNYIEMTVTRTNGDTETYIIGRESAPDSHMADPKDRLVNGRFTHTIAGYGHIDLQQGDVITFELKNHSGLLEDMQLSDGRISVIVDSSDEVLKGNNFPIVDNLPEIKVPDFIKFLAAITGTFPLQSATSSTITFVDIATIWGNKGSALDWTRKIVPSYNDDKPKEVEFKLSEWAQTNWFKWAEDERTTGDYNGKITIPDTTLEATRDIFEFPFAASDGVSIPTYTREKVNGIFGTNVGEGSTMPQYSACKPRIATIRTDDNGKAQLFFDSSLNMQNIISNKYAEVVATLQNAKVIKDIIRLSNVEILNFNETIPIYLAQHGAYFAVLDIKAASNGTAEVTMLKMSDVQTPPPPPPPLPDYLCLTALESGTISFTIPTYVTSTYLSYVEWSKDGENWTRWTNDDAGTTINVNVDADDKVYWRGSGESMTSGSYASDRASKFTSTARFDASGHLLSLLKGTDYDDITGVEKMTFCRLFYGCTTIINAQDLVMPSFTSYYTHIFYQMFRECTNLVSAPILPSLNMANYCCYQMFYKCTSLTTTAQMLATTFASFCCNQMYRLCTALTTALPLVATTLATSCCQEMFGGCTALTTISNLPTATLAESCYKWMCNGCTSLNYVKCLATDLSASTCLTAWMANVAANGTFVKATGVVWPSGTSGIPTGWTVNEE